MCSNSCDKCSSSDVCVPYVNPRETWKDTGLSLTRGEVKDQIQATPEEEKKTGWWWLLSAIPFIAGA